MNNKKTIIMCLIFTFLMGIFSGCGFSTNKNQGEKSQNVAQKEVANDNSDKELTKTDDKNGKMLVVYYSATGSTEAVANTIAEYINADVFEVKPVEPYSNDDLNWSNDNSRVTKEHDDPNSRDVELTSTTVDNWESYDTVF